MDALEQLGRIVSIDSQIVEQSRRRRQLRTRNPVRLLKQVNDHLLGIVVHCRIVDATSVGCRLLAYGCLPGKNEFAKKVGSLWWPSSS